MKHSFIFFLPFWDQVPLVLVGAKFDFSLRSLTLTWRKLSVLSIDVGYKMSSALFPWSSTTSIALFVDYYKTKNNKKISNSNLMVEIFIHDEHFSRKKFTNCMPTSVSVIWLCWNIYLCWGVFTKKLKLNCADHFRFPL